MKPILISTISILSMLYSFSSSGQIWMTDSLKWRETREENFGNITTTSFVIWATETINDTLYRRIHQTNCSIAPVADLFVCHFRGEENKVYARVNGEEYLLYDFDLEVGDTYAPKLCSTVFGEIEVLDSGLEMYEVIDVSTILINGEERKLISFNSSNLQWIEGVGSNKGLFHGTQVCATDNISRLTCLERNLEVEYMNPEFEVCCIFMLSSETEHYNYERPVVYPNPVSLSESLRLSEKIEKGYLSIFSQEGKLMHAERIDKNAALTPSEMGLSPGLYHIQLEMDKARLHQKIVVY